MYQFNELTYAAILTIQLPGSSEPMQAHVTLAPPDSIETPAGSKLLRDCTLADLQQFATQLEQDVWETQGQIKLYDLTMQADALVNLVVINEEDEQIAPGDAWLDGARLVLGLAEIEKETKAEAVKLESTSDQSSEKREKKIVEKKNKKEETAEAEVEDIPITDLTVTPPAVTVPISMDTPTITVAESEPVHPERKASETPKPEVSPVDKAMLKVKKSDLENRTAGQKLRPFSQSNTAVDVLFDEIPFRQAQAHADTSLNREVAGVLVGPHPEKQPDGRYIVHITDVIAAKHTKMQGASVTYTPESWRYISDVMQERYPEEECVIVGWYHTHPGFGIFLSNMDLFIHHNFFTQKWHIALVLDPVGKKSGFFTWDKAQTAVLAYEFPWPYWAHRTW